MIDALYPGSIPAGVTCDIVAAYIDHTANPHSYDQAVAKFPNAIHVKISVKATIGADVLDCETSTGITPAMCPAWVKVSRAAGGDPTIYCNQNNGWAAVRKAFQQAGVPEPHYWVANYDGNPAIPAGAVAKQYTDLDAHGVNTYDTSSVVEGWPSALDPSGGGTPIPVPSPTPDEDDDMKPYIVNDPTGSYIVAPDFSTRIRIPDPQDVTAITGTGQVLPLTLTSQFLYNIPVPGDPEKAIVAAIQAGGAA
jgi:hypothetical protein